jgi:transposase InsO family protein
VRLWPSGLVAAAIPIRSSPYSRLSLPSAEPPGHLRMDNGTHVICRSVAREYNTYRPHSPLGGLTPAEWLKKWTTRPALP